MNAVAEASDQAYRLIPTRSRIGNSWYSSWVVTGLELARSEARAFFDEEGVPVMVCVLDEPGRPGRHVLTVPTVAARKLKRAA